MATIKIVSLLSLATVAASAPTGWHVHRKRLLSEHMVEGHNLSMVAVSTTFDQSLPIITTAVLSSSTSLFSSGHDVYSMMNIDGATPPIMDVALHFQQEVQFRMAKIKFTVSNGDYVETDVDRQFRCHKGKRVMLRGVQLPNDWPERFRTGKPLRLCMEIIDDKSRRLLSSDFNVQISRS